MSDELLLTALLEAGVPKDRVLALGRALTIAERVDTGIDRGTRCIEVPAEVYENEASKHGFIVDWGLPDATGFYSPTMHPLDPT